MAGHAKTRIRTLMDNKRAAHLSVSPTSAALTMADATQQLTASFTDHGGAALAFVSNTVSYASSDETVATVDSSGLVTLVAEGDATITASATLDLNGAVSADCTINVSNPHIVLTPTSRSFAATSGGANPATQTVAVSNSGNGTLTPTVGTINYAEGSGWAAATYSSTTGLVTISLTTGALSAGTYHCTIPIASTGAENTPQSISVTFTVS